MFVKYDQLDVYQRAFAVALAIHHLTLTFPKIEQYGGMADQMRRASKGICANLAEGLGKLSSPLEESRFMSISLGSCEEMRVWLQFSHELGYCPPEQAEAYRTEYEALRKMIYALIQRRK